MTVRILTGDCRDVLRTLPSESVHCIVTSPPYFGLRDYGHAGQIGLEQTPAEYVAEMVALFGEARRVLRSDGTLWLNLGDSYTASSPGQTSGRVTDAASKQATNVGSDIGAPHRNGTFGLLPKNMIGIPWRVAFALQADGWYLRQDIIWHKPNPMPESVKDRCTKAHEYVFLFAKSSTYHYDADAIAEASVGEPPISRMNMHDGLKAAKLQSLAASTLGTPADTTRNRRSVWTIATQPYSEAHFATMAPELAETCIKAGCPVGGTVLDPFGGSGTTGLVADRLGRNAILIELNPAYAAMAHNRLSDDAGMFADIASLKEDAA